MAPEKFAGSSPVPDTNYRGYSIGCDGAKQDPSVPTFGVIEKFRRIRQAEIVLCQRLPENQRVLSDHLESLSESSELRSRIHRAAVATCHSTQDISSERADHNAVRIQLLSTSCFHDLWQNAFSSRACNGT